MQKRRRVKQVHSLEHRLTEEAKSLREEAKTLPPGIEQERLLMKARQADTAAHISEWLSSPGLMPPQ
ncbi:hypothetical protein [Bradyrhizobium sp. ORS 111]|uniref:hypothetical protein n=1 Tax=Bradyrhizobium sp. ORS 111 TaxID=1685958 RepID=UPI00388F5683